MNNVIQIEKKLKITNKSTITQYDKLVKKII